MPKFKKDFNVRIISLIVAVLFLFNSTACGINTPPRSHLRVPIGESDTYKRLTEAIKTWEEQEKRSAQHSAYKRLLKTILREAEDTLAYFYTRNGVPEAEGMAHNFAEDALASIIRRETELNFRIPYLPEDFPTLLQLMDNIADKSSSEQEMFLNKYIRQIVGALLFLEIPTYLRNQWSQSAAASQKFPLLGNGNTTIVGAMSQSDLQREYKEQGIMDDSTKKDVVLEPWYRQKIDASKIVDDEFIRENHAVIIKMAGDIETATSGMVKAYNIRDFDIEEYLRAWKVFEQICMMGVSGPEEMEQFMFEFQFLSNESSNRVKDQWGYFNNSAIPKVRRLLKEMFADSYQEIIDKDPLAFAVKLFVDFVKEQPFHETNHRTADFLMNFILIKHGLPIFLLTPDNVIEYYQLTNARNLQDENFDEASFKQIYAFFRREIENKARHIALPAQAVGSLSIYAPTVELPIEKSKPMDKISRNSTLSSSI